jgi:hypothetical protein
VHGRTDVEWRVEGDEFCGGIGLGLQPVVAHDGHPIGHTVELGGEAGGCDGSSGLIRREACPNDRRSSYAVITDEGMQRLAEVLPGHLELVQRWYVDLLPETKLTELLDSLRTIRDAVNPCATAGSAETALPV